MKRLGEVYGVNWKDALKEARKSSYIWNRDYTVTSVKKIRIGLSIGNYAVYGKIRVRAKEHKGRMPSHHKPIGCEWEKLWKPQTTRIPFEERMENYRIDGSYNGG